MSVEEKEYTAEEERQSFSEAEHQDSPKESTEYAEEEKRYKEGSEKEYPSEMEKDKRRAGLRNYSVERSRQNGKIALFVLCIFAMLFSFVLGGAAVYLYYFSTPAVFSLQNTEKETDKEEINLFRVSTKLKDLQELITENYLYTENAEKAEDGIYKGFLNSLLEEDPYAAYYTKEEIEESQNQQKGIYQGIGAEVTETDEGIRIEYVYPDSPAEKGGLKAGDIILRVDGISVRDLSLQYIVQNLIQGVEGSSLEMIVLRENEEVTLRLTRGEIVIPPVESGDAATMLKDSTVPEGEIGYLSLRGFYEEAVEEFISQYEKEIEGKKKGLIIDLRGNPGGDVDAATRLLDYFLPDDLPKPVKATAEASGAIRSITDREFLEGETLLLYTEDKHGNGKEWYADDRHEVDMPIVILVNQNSASASELFSGAMQDYGRAIVMGTQSYGKGIVQTIRSFTDGSAVEFTTHYYFTPAGRNIHKKGITPDVKVEIPEEDGQSYVQDRTKDSQLRKGAETLYTNFIHG